MGSLQECGLGTNVLLREQLSGSHCTHQLGAERHPPEPVEGRDDGVARHVDTRRRLGHVQRRLLVHRGLLIASTHTVQ